MIYIMLFIHFEIRPRLAYIWLCELGWLNSCSPSCTSQVLVASISSLWSVSYSKIKAQNWLIFIFVTIQLWVLFTVSIRVKQNIMNFLVFLFFKIRCLCVAKIVLELILWTSLDSKSQRSACLCLLSAGIKVLVPPLPNQNKMNWVKILYLPGTPYIVGSCLFNSTVFAF